MDERRAAAGACSRGMQTAAAGEEVWSSLTRQGPRQGQRGHCLALQLSRKTVSPSEIEGGREGWREGGEGAGSSDGGREESR